jgi:ChpA-C
MHHSTKRRVVLGMTTGGLLIGGLGMGVAQADTAATGGAADSPGVLSGNLIQIPVSIPVNVCGNSVSVVGILDSASGNTCSNSGSAASTANGGASNSPGVGSGNLLQIPVSVPVNVCGNSISGVGVGDSASDNHCSNGGSGSAGGVGGTANGGSSNSPGVGSGNTVQVPVTAPVNVCGNDVSVVGILDSATGNTCANGGSVPTSPGHPTPPCGCHPTPPIHTTPPPRHTTPPKHTTPSTSRPTGPTPRHISPTSEHGWKASGTLAETGSGASNVVTPLGAGVLGGSGLLLRKRVSTLRHLTHRQH